MNYCTVNEIVDIYLKTFVFEYFPLYIHDNKTIYYLDHEVSHMHVPVLERTFASWNKYLCI